MKTMAINQVRPSQVFDCDLFYNNNNNNNNNFIQLIMKFAVLFVFLVK